MNKDMDMTEEIKNEQSYDASDIEVLEGLEAVRKRPGMYIGTTGPAGLHHLVYEIVDNSIDEALAGYCSEIRVRILPGEIIEVTDNGRGIPVGIQPKVGLPAVTVVYTILHAGGKFSGKGYHFSGGLHGVGASVVNALSEWLEVSVFSDDGKMYFQRFNRGKQEEDLKVIDFKVVDRERISPREADMMTKRDEYVILNELDIDPADFTKASCSYTVRSQETAYDTGRLFVIFNSDNSHVSNKIYKLHDDVFGSVFVNDLGQLIVSSFSRENADAIEKAILTEMRDDEVFLAARYSFDMPVLYEYVRSGFDDFEDFVDAISFDSSDD